MNRATGMLSRGEFPTELHRYLLGGPTNNRRRDRSVASLTFPEDSIKEPAYQTIMQRVAETIKSSNSADWKAAVRQTVESDLDEQTLAGLVLHDSGRHIITAGLAIVCGDADIELRNDAVVIAVGDCSVTARHTSQVFATDRVEVIVYDDAYFFVDGGVTLDSYGRTRGKYSGTGSGRAHGESQVIVGGQVYLDALDGAYVYAEEDARIRCFSNSQARIRTRAFALLFDGAVGWFEGESTGKAAGRSRANVKQPARVSLAGSEARIVTVDDDQPLTTLNWPSW